MVVTGTQRELVVIDILRTDAPLNLLHLLLETAGSIVETLEDGRDGTEVVVLVQHALLVV